MISASPFLCWLVFVVLLCVWDHYAKKDERDDDE